MEADAERIVADEQLTLSDNAWEQAKNRATVIGALAKRRITGIAAADEAATKLGVSRRRVYLLLGRYRQGSGLVTDLALHRSTGGKGGNRLPGGLAGRWGFAGQGVLCRWFVPDRLAAVEDDLLSLG